MSSSMYRSFFSYEPGSGVWVGSAVAVAARGAVAGRSGAAGSSLPHPPAASANGKAIQRAARGQDLGALGTPRSRLVKVPPTCSMAANTAARDPEADSNVVQQVE